MTADNTRQVPYNTFLCCIPVRVGVVVSLRFIARIITQLMHGIVPFPSWLLRGRCNGSLFDYTDEALAYDLAYHC